MKKMAGFFALFVFAAFLAVAIQGCYQNDKEYPVLITVKYKSNEVPIEGADVVITKKQVLVQLQSNSAGQCKYTFELPAILEVHAEIDTSTTSGTPPLTGSTTIRLEEDKTVEKTVYVQ
ncbi:MAG: hypothetical protein V2A54_02715 [Bacteroidota bacterium]